MEIDVKNNKPQWRIIPSILFAAHKQKHAGAVRLAFAIGNLSNWQGDILVDSLISGIHNYQKLHEDTIARWFEDAEKFGIISLTKNRQRVFVISREKIAHLLGMKSEDLGEQVTIDPEKLFCRRWKPFVFASFQSTLGATRPVSQKYIEAKTGISVRSQTNFNQKSGIKIINNNLWVCKGDQKVADGFMETFGGYFFSRDGIVYQRLPNNYVSENSHKVGSTEDIKKALNILNGVSDEEEALTCKILTLGNGAETDRKPRSYAHNFDAAKRIDRRMRKFGQDGDIIVFLEHHDKESGGGKSSNTWVKWG